MEDTKDRRHAIRAEDRPMYMSDLNMTTFREAISRIDTVIIPIGMIEAHGPHCSLATDILIPREFLKRLDSVIGDKVLMGSEIAYGHSWGLAPFPGTIDVSGETFGQYVFEVAKGFLHNGLKNIVLFNGHGGNMSALGLVSEKLAQLGATVLTINWWVDYRDTIRLSAPETGHAGEDETSVVMAISSHLVELDKLGERTNHVISVPGNVKFKDGGRASYPDAFSGNAGAATVEKGEEILNNLVPLVIRDIEAMWSLAR